MRIENSPGSYGFLAGLLVLLLAAVANSGCMRDVRGRDAGVAFESTVSISIACADEDGNTMARYGSGVIVNETTVLTAAHVAVDPPGYICMRRATMVNGKEYVLSPGEHALRSNLDVATLKLSRGAFAPTYPVVYGPKPGFGTRVCAMTAYPRWLWRCGDAQTTHEPSETTPANQLHTIIVEPGNSGSGVYDTQGRLVGIVTHRFECSNNNQNCGGLMVSLEGQLAELGL